MSVFKKYLSKKSEVLWTPSELSGLIGWFDGDDSSTLTFNGSTVSQWDNKADSSNPASQTDSTKQPTTAIFYSRQALNFNTTYFTTPVVMPVRSALIVVNDAFNGYQNNSYAAEITPMFGENKSSNQNYTFLRTNRIEYSISIDGATTNSGNASANGNSPISGTNINLGLSNAEKESTNIFYIDFNVVAPTDLIAIMIAGVNTYTTNISIGEILFLDNVIDVTTRQKAEGYLAHKWELTSQLPANHPYKTSTPVI